jgi:hypothetical protein
MVDEEMADQWLREAMTSETPRLSPRFEDQVIASVRPRRLTTAARLVMAFYAIVALALSAWTMREMSVALVAASIPLALVAVGGSRYVRRIVTMAS